MRFGGDATVFSPVGGPPFVYDIERGRRYGTLEDLQNFIKLAHMAPAIHFSGGCMCEPMEIPPNKRHLDVQYSFFRYSDQGCEATPETPGHARDAVALARVLFGAEYLETHPVVLGNINSNSPLVFDGRMLGALREFAGANQGTIIVPAVLAGAMGPVTAAGCLAEILAETLAGMALTQIVRPGAPVILGSFVGAISMRTGAPTFGTPEATQMIFATAQLARRLGVPCRSGGSLCSSKIADAQAAYESAHTLLPTLLAGVNLVTHAAGWLEGGLVAGYEKFVMDADQLAMMQSLSQGMDLSERGQALEAIREVGSGQPLSRMRAHPGEFRDGVLSIDDCRLFVLRAMVDGGEALGGAARQCGLEEDAGRVPGPRHRSGRAMRPCGTSSPSARRCCTDAVEEE